MLLQKAEPSWYQDIDSELEKQNKMNNNFFSNMKTKLDAIALVHENDAPAVADQTDVVDTVTLDVPLLLRMLEYAKEDAKSDLDLHDVTERMISLAKTGTLSMQHYDDIVKQDLPQSTQEAITEAQFDEAAGEKDACYHKVKSRYKVWPSAYASGALTRCRKVGAANWGNKDKK
jgi:hypothetical protein